MKLRTFVTLGAAALMMVAVSQSASAQVRFDFKVPFGFTAGGKAFAAGDYDLFANTNASGDMLTLEAKAAKGGTAILPVETRTAPHEGATAPEVVFDKLNGQLLLSELVVPGEDGYLVLVTKAKHAHERLKGTRAK